MSRPEDDPYSPSIVSDLLNGKNEWKNIQDIIKLTFKAICDTVKSQGQAIRELNRQLSLKANQSELVMHLNNKANVSEVSKFVAEIQGSIEDRISHEELNRQMEDRVTK